MDFNALFKTNQYTPISQFIPTFYQIPPPIPPPSHRYQPVVSSLNVKAPAFQSTNLNAKAPAFQSKLHDETMNGYHHMDNSSDSIKVSMKLEEDDCLSKYTQTNDNFNFQKCKEIQTDNEDASMKDLNLSGYGKKLEEKILKLHHHICKNELMKSLCELQMKFNSISHLYSNGESNLEKNLDAVKNNTIDELDRLQKLLNSNLFEIRNGKSLNMLEEIETIIPLYHIPIRPSEVTRDSFETESNMNVAKSDHLSSTVNDDQELNVEFPKVNITSDSFETESNVSYSQCDQSSIAVKDLQDLDVEFFKMNITKDTFETASNMSYSKSDLSSIAVKDSPKLNVETPKINIPKDSPEAGSNMSYSKSDLSSIAGKDSPRLNVETPKMNIPKDSPETRSNMSYSKSDLSSIAGKDSPILNVETPKMNVTSDSLAIASNMNDSKSDHSSNTVKDLDELSAEFPKVNVSRSPFEIGSKMDDFKSDHSSNAVEESQETNVEIPKVNIECVTQLWMYTQHLHSKPKRKSMIGMAANMNLTGFFMPGEPGIIYIEGFDLSVQKFWDIINQWKWKKLSIKNRCEILKNANDDSSLRKFSSFEEKTFNPKVGKENKIIMDMKLFYDFLKSYDFSHIYELYFGMNKPV